jgi:hypothetical protein
MPCPLVPFWSVRAGDSLTFDAMYEDQSARAGRQQLRMSAWAPLLNTDDIKTA